MQIFLIGISGLKRSGKDTVADYLVKHFDFRKLSFSDKLKELARSGKEAILEYMPWLSESDLEPFSDVLPWTGEKDSKSRKLLQTLGTEFGRNHDKNIWISSIRDRMKSLLTTKEVVKDQVLRVVIPDCRFKNEMNFIRQPELEASFSSCFMWRVLRPELQEEMLKDPHPSEQEQLSVQNDWFDRVILNEGTLKDLEFETLKSVAKFFYISALEK